MRWMNLESIIRSEVSQKEKDKYHILMRIYRILKMVLKNLFVGQQWRNSHKNRLIDMGRGEERLRCMERVTWKLILPCVK